MPTATPQPAAPRDNEVELLKREVERLQREAERFQNRARVLAIFVGVLMGVIGALVAILVSGHYGATSLERAIYGGGTFVTFSAFVLYLEEKLHLL